MKKVYILLSMLAAIVLYSSCNDEWKDEQFEHSVSFKAPLSDLGVSPIYIPYYTNQAVAYQLPLVVSGSTTNSKNITVHVEVDSDTLKTLNAARFQNRLDHHYHELTSQYFSMPPTVDIKAGEDIGLMQIDFTLQGIDLVNKWLLPLTIEENESYVTNQRKHYKKALLRVIPFNEYSETYSGTALEIYARGFSGNDTMPAIAKQTIQTYVVNESSIFFYAGNIDENRADRRLYKVNAEFNRQGSTTSSEENVVEFGEVVLSVEEGSENKMKFVENARATYTITESMNDVRPYLKHRFITISGIDYGFVDHTNVDGVEFEFQVTGSLIQERKINTQIPDKDQAIEW